ncbi:MAG: hypothetical protein Q3M24_11170 [Candidatus Electrothrix aestuarii]|uniref:Uncharacterized protein n=1 Tax=Candidatus Electrothrix aestuarii TaxID=3062594 RepID=A0AAU8M1K4_9BACT|nr:hypothetical protein [Candidatus Electrothrix aestuarii]
MQIPKLVESRGPKAADAALRARTFFPAHWSELQIHFNVMRVYRAAVKTGITNGHFEKQVGGFLIRVGLKDGRIDTAFGFVKMTLEDFKNLF